MNTIELLEDDFKEYLKVNIDMGYKHSESIAITRREIIQLYGLKQPYDNKALEHLNTLASTY